MARRAVTNISDLPDMESIPQQNVQPSQYMQYDNMPNLEKRAVPENIKKMIRPSQVMNPGAGMASYESQQPQIAEPPQPIQYSSPPPIQKEINPLYDITCLQIAMHVKNCPICSKMYKCDSTIYILIIVILSVITLLLIKKLTQ